ncbi:MAG TPA: peptidoglycan-binding domain-containing protein [Pyrinomonadaceae bacterium]|nr:peptidoglycan-binding domain-containing protein [Pyrinomonadaceae bacterium]
MPIRHEIKQGESVISLSELHGLFADTIWNAPENAELKEKRKNMNILLPGDILFIPDKRPKEVSRETNNVHKFQRKGIPALFRLQLFDIEEPRANQDYTLDVDGQMLTGKTDSRGVLEQYLPAISKKGVLIIKADESREEYRLEINFGYLDPINETAGVKKRLNNMGYDCGEPNNKLNDDMKLQLRLFQKRFNLEETGEVDAPTLAKLEELHENPKEFPPADDQSTQGGVQ